MNADAILFWMMAYVLVGALSGTLISVLIDGSVPRAWKFIAFWSVMWCPAALLGIALIVIDELRDLLKRDLRDLLRR